MPSRETRRWEHFAADKEKRQIRKQIKRNRKTKRVRHKDWTSYDVEDQHDFDDIPQSERIMPRGERERRQAVMAAARTALEKEEHGESEAHLSQQAHPQQRGIVVEVSSGLCRVSMDKRTLMCGIRGGLSAEESGFTNVIAVGDDVLISEDGAGMGVVEAVLPRRSVLARPDVFHDGYRTRDRRRQQVIAANVDQLLIVASWRSPHLWPELVDRYLITAERNHLSPIICINKVDLAEDANLCHETLQPYVDLGYRVLYTSAITGEGVPELRAALDGHLTVLAGMSGVGKSSLLATVEPGLQLRTRMVSEQSGEGKHTTTQVQMLKLEAGGSVIDTPGIREFGLSDLVRGELIRFYPEIAAVAGCRFSNCSHTHEPGCAVKAAVQQGIVSAMRYHSYKKIIQDLP